MINSQSLEIAQVVYAELFGGIFAVVILIFLYTYGILFMSLVMEYI